MTSRGKWWLKFVPGIILGAVLLYVSPLLYLGCLLGLVLGAIIETMPKQEVEDE